MRKKVLLLALFIVVSLILTTEYKPVQAQGCRMWTETWAVLRYPDLLIVDGPWVTTHDTCNQWDAFLAALNHKLCNDAAQEAANRDTSGQGYRYACRQIH